MASLSLVALFGFGAALAAAPPEEDTWDLSHVFATVDDWEAAMAAAEGQVDALASCEGKVDDGAAALRGCMDSVYDAYRALSHLDVYASNHANVDLRDDTWRARSARSDLLWPRIGAATAWLAPEVVALGEKKLAKYLKQEPGLAVYAYPLRVMQQDAAHTLSPPEEELLAASGTVRGASTAAYRVLMAAEVPWPTVTLSDGSEVVLDRTGYATWRGAPDREDRQLVFDAFYATLADYQDTVGALLDGHVQGHWFMARARGYDTSLAASLDRNHLPPEVYRTLVSETNAHLPTLHRYLALRGRMLGLDEVRYSDLYPPLIDRSVAFSLDEAKELAIASAAPLGADYVSILEEGFSNRWMDVWPQPGKANGAYMSGSAYDVHPYVLMNFTEDYESVSTLAHEWGHAGHSALSSKAQPFPLSDYATFIAEVASTFNEALLLDYMLEAAESDEDRLYYLGFALENLRGTYFRQAMFAEFELAVHERVEAGEPLTGGAISEIYLDILRRYHGHDAGAAVIDEAWGTEWAYIHHFFAYDFYVFQYATSIAASASLAERVLEGEDGAVERYLDLLRAGGSDDPYPLLLAAGVDLASPEPYAALDRRMNAIMDEMESILDRLPAEAPVEVEADPPAAE